jgi:hypothetical protein
LKGRNPFAFLFVTSRREQYLAQHVLREHARDRALADILEDPYVRNRSTAAERARLLERPEVVATIGERIVADLRRALVEPLSLTSHRATGLTTKPPQPFRGRPGS